MLEQAVSRRDNTRGRRWGKVLRTIQILLLLATVALVVFGFTLAGVFWETDRAVFWRWCVQIVILALPAVGFMLLLQAMIDRLRLEYDYTLQGPSVCVYRLLGNRRIWRLSFDVRGAELLAETGRGEEGAVALSLPRGTIDLTRNEDAPHLVLLRVRGCHQRHGQKDCCLLLEMEEKFYAAFRRQLQGRAP